MPEVPFDLSGVRVLIVDDMPANLGVLFQVLETAHYQVLVATSGEEALLAADASRPDMILLDVLMPGLDGFETCRRLKAQPDLRDVPVIFITARSKPHEIVEGFAAGGVDYILKPFQTDEVLIRVKTHLERARLLLQLQDMNQELRRTNEALQAEIRRGNTLTRERDHLADHLSLMTRREAERWGIQGMVGQSPMLQQILDDIRLLQQAGTTTVLITGESGTGKELIARAIHFGGGRAQKPFVPVNCSAIPADLAEATLFGHTRGAFTGATASRQGVFELADGGTLSLDEIGDMPLSLQAKFLRVLEDGAVTPVGGTQTRVVDVRIIAATNTDLQGRIAGGAFRQDLYFRLARFTVDVPPLRERPEDIPLLAEHFLHLLAAEMRKEGVTFSPDALSALQAYQFPGNIRELKNIVEHALIVNRGGQILPHHLRLIITAHPAVPPLQVGPPRSPVTAPPDLRPLESLVVKRAVTRSPHPLEADEERLLAYVREYGSINNAECRDLLAVPRNRAKHLLQKLQRYGLLVQVGDHRWARYRHA